MISLHHPRNVMAHTQSVIGTRMVLVVNLRTIVARELLVIVMKQARVHLQDALFLTRMAVAWR